MEVATSRNVLEGFDEIFSQKKQPASIDELLKLFIKEPSFFEGRLVVSGSLAVVGQTTNDFKNQHLLLKLITRPDYDILSNYKLSADGQFVCSKKQFNSLEEKIIQVNDKMSRPFTSYRLAPFDLFSKNRLFSALTGNSDLKEKFLASFRDIMAEQFSLTMVKELCAHSFNKFNLDYTPIASHFYGYNPIACKADYEDDVKRYHITPESDSAKKFEYYLKMLEMVPKNFANLLYEVKLCEERSSYRYEYRHTSEESKAEIAEAKNKLHGLKAEVGEAVKQMMKNPEFENMLRNLAHHQAVEMDMTIGMKDLHKLDKSCGVYAVGMMLHRKVSASKCCARLDFHLLPLAFSNTMWTVDLVFPNTENGHFDYSCFSRIVKGTVDKERINNVLAEYFGPMLLQEFVPAMNANKPQLNAVLEIANNLFDGPETYNRIKEDLIKVFNK